MRFILYTLYFAITVGLLFVLYKTIYLQELENQLLVNTYVIPQAEYDVPENPPDEALGPGVICTDDCPTIQ